MTNLSVKNVLQFASFTVALGSVWVLGESVLSLILNDGQLTAETFLFAGCSLAGALFGLELTKE